MQGLVTWPLDDFYSTISGHFRSCRGEFVTVLNFIGLRLDLVLVVILPAYLYPWCFVFSDVASRVSFSRSVRFGAPDGSFTSKCEHENYYHCQNILLSTDIKHTITDVKSIRVYLKLWLLLLKVKRKNDWIWRPLICYSPKKYSEKQTPTTTTTAVFFLFCFFVYITWFLSANRIRPSERSLVRSVCP